MSSDRAITAADIVIIGGGMVGLSMAHILAQNTPALRVCVIEKHALAPRSDEITMPSFDGRSSALSLGTVEVFQALGLWDAMAPVATAIREIHVSDRGHFGRVSYGENGQPLGYIVPNHALGQALVQPANFEVRAPASVSAIKMTRTGAELEVTANGVQQTIAAQLVIVADGADSSVREALGINARRHNYAQHALVANLEFELAHGGRAFERFTAEGPMALLPLGASHNSTRVALVWTRPEQQIASTMALSETAFIEQLHQCFGFRLGRITKVGARAHYPLQLLIAEEQVRSSLVVLGNAAHFLHPVAGQGFNLALRDGLQLASVLAQASANGVPLGELSVLTQYLQLQANDQALTIAISHNFNRLFSNNRPWLQAARNTGLLCLDIFNAPKQIFFGAMMGRSQPQPPLAILKRKAHG